MFEIASYGGYAWACHFPVIFDNSRIIISGGGHFECMITDTHNTFYNSKIILIDQVNLHNCYRYLLKHACRICV